MRVLLWLGYHVRLNKAFEILIFLFIFFFVKFNKVSLSIDNNAGGTSITDLLELDVTTRRLW